MMFDSKKLDVSSDTYEDISPNASEPRGESAHINVVVDADHVGGKITRS